MRLHETVQLIVTFQTSKVGFHFVVKPFNIFFPPFRLEANGRTTVCSQIIWQITLLRNSARLSTTKLSLLLTEAGDQGKSTGHLELE